MDFTAPTLGGAIQAVLLPHLHMSLSFGIVVLISRIQNDIGFLK